MRTIALFILSIAGLFASLAAGRAALRSGEIQLQSEPPSSPAPTPSSGVPMQPTTPNPGQPLKTETAYFAGGCFWGVEDRFQQLPGVVEAISGYMGGKTKDPTYKEVCTDETGHAETVKVVFDPTKITYAQLLEKFFRFHNPTQLNYQGPDYGTQYRSAIFATDDKQAEEAKKFVAAQQATDRFKGKKIVTQVVAVKDSGPFYKAEDYHQDYHIKHGGHCAMPEE